MAPTKKCPECQMTMYGDEKKYEPRGTTVVYICRNGACPSAKRGYPSQEKVFVPS